MTDVRNDPELWSELRSLFTTEARRHLALVRDDLSHLERGSRSTADLAEAVRAVHTLRGSAAMLGMRALEATAHVCEEALEGLHDGRSEPSVELLSRLSGAIDAYAETVEEFAGGRAPDECAHSFDVGGLRAAAGGPGAAEHPRRPAGSGTATDGPRGFPGAGVEVASFGTVEPRCA